MTEYYYSNELYHHGILGMKWGIRRFQPYPKGHKGGKEVGEAAKAKEKKESHADFKAVNKYIKGAILGTSIAGLAVGGYYLYKKYGTDYLDTFIKRGTVLNTVTSGKTDWMKDSRFYASFGKDTDRYLELLSGKTLVKNEAIKNLKIASPNSGKKALFDVYKEDHEFRSVLRESAKRGVKQGIIDSNKYEDALRYLKSDNVKRKFHFDTTEEYNPSKKIQNEVYEIWNTMQVDKNPWTLRNNKKVYDVLRNSGYSGLVDVNDLKYSGYNTKKPVVIFNNNDLVEKAIETVMSSDRESAGLRFESYKEKTEKINKIISRLSILAMPVGASIGAVSYPVSEDDEKK